MLVKSGQDETGSKVSSGQKKQERLLDEELIFKIPEKDRIAFVAVYKLVKKFRITLRFDFLLFSQENKMEG